jgi:hypothetical protein
MITGILKRAGGGEFRVCMGEGLTGTLRDEMEAHPEKQRDSESRDRKVRR